MKKQTPDQDDDYPFEDLKRIALQVGNDVCAALLKALDHKGVRSYDFVVDSGSGRVWLVFKCDDQEAVHALAEATAPVNLPMHMGGMTKESLDRFNARKNTR